MPITALGEFCTVAHLAHELACSRKTVERHYIVTGVLTVRPFRDGERGPGKRIRLLTAEVKALVEGGVEAVRLLQARKRYLRVG
jgi:hypothetical protein